MNIKLSPEQNRGIWQAFSFFNEVRYRDCDKAKRIENLLECLENIWDERLFKALSSSFEMVCTKLLEYEFIDYDIEQMDSFCGVVSEIIHSQFTRHAIEDDILQEGDLVILDAMKRAIDIHVLEPLDIERKPSCGDLKLMDQDRGSMSRST